MSHTPPWGNMFDGEPVEKPPRLYPELSDREYEIANALARGLQPREIATAYGLNLKTVGVHRHNILKKLALRNNVELARRFIRDGAVKP